LRSLDNRLTITRPNRSRGCGPEPAGLAPERRVQANMSELVPERRPFEMIACGPVESVQNLKPWVDGRSKARSVRGFRVVVELGGSFLDKPDELVGGGSAI
jgi:hypothetical protein